MRKKCFLIIVAVTLFRVMLFGDDYWELTGYNECANRIVINEDDVLFASGHLGLKVSYDLGETWESVEEPPITSTSSRVLYLNNSNLYYAGAGSRIYRSNIDIIDWELMYEWSGSYSGIIDTEKFDDFFLVCSWGQIVKFDENFSNPKIVLQTACYEAFYTLAKDSAGTYYAGSGNFMLQGGLYKSYDEGETWEGPIIFDNLTNMHVICVVVDQDGRIFVGTDGKIYRSLDNGESFHAVAGNGSLSVFGMHVNSRGDIFATLDSNAMVSYDHGDNWVFIGSGLGGGGIEMQSIVESQDGYLFISSFGRGVFRSVNSTTGVIDEDLIAKSGLLSYNYPNPFNPTTRIEFNISEFDNSHVQILIFNSAGQIVQTMNNLKPDSGNDFVMFNGSDLNSGVYFYTLVVNGQSIDTKKMMLLK